MIISKVLNTVIDNKFHSIIGGGDAVLIPNTIPGLELFLKADEANVIKDGADKVSQWTDLSTQGRDLTEGLLAEQPVFEAVSSFNSKPGILFSNNQLSTTNGFFSGLTEFTAFFVLRPNDVAGDKTYFHDDSTLGDSYAGVVLNFHKVQQTGFVSAYTDGANLDTNKILRWQREDLDPGATLTEKFFNYGSELGSNLKNVTADTGGILKLGKRFTFDVFEGTMHEVLIYNRLLTPSEITTIEDYLVAEWGTA